MFHGVTQHPIISYDVLCFIMFRCHIAQLGLMVAQGVLRCLVVFHNTPKHAYKHTNTHNTYTHARTHYTHSHTHTQLHTQTQTQIQLYHAHSVLHFCHNMSLYSAEARCLKKPPSKGFFFMERIFQWTRVSLAHAKCLPCLPCVHSEIQYNCTVHVAVHCLQLSTWQRTGNSNQELCMGFICDNCQLLIPFSILSHIRSDMSLEKVDIQINLGVNMQYSANVNCMTNLSNYSSSLDQPTQVFQTCLH